MRLTVLGCSGGVPGPESPASGYLLEHDGTRLMLDMGNGTVGRLQRVASPFDLDAVLLSHLHPDHCADFAAMTVLRRFHPRLPDLGRLPLFGPPEASERLAALYAANPAELAETDLSDFYDFRPPPEEPVRIGPFEITAIPVNHVVPTWGYRVAAGGKVLAYTGDTGPCESLTVLARDVDALLCEASWAEAPDQPSNLHLSGRQAGELATRAGVGQLLLTHLLAWSDRDPVDAEARAAFAGATEWVVPDGRYTV